MTAVLESAADIPAHVARALVCLHGFGADGNDVIGLAGPLRAALGPALSATLAVVAPHAPTLTPMGQGRQWFRDNGWSFRDPAGLAAITRQLWQWLEATVLVQHRLQPAQVALLGFSQGAMLALYAAPRWPQPLAGVIAAAGMLTEPLPDSPPQRPPFLLLHGQQDDVVPADASVAAANALKEKNIPAELVLLPGLGHGLDAAALAEMAVFLQSLWSPAANT